MRWRRTQLARGILGILASIEIFFGSRATAQENIAVDHEELSAKQQRLATVAATHSEG